MFWSGRGGNIDCKRSRDGREAVGRSVLQGSEDSEEHTCRPRLKHCRRQTFEQTKGNTSHAFYLYHVTNGHRTVSRNTLMTNNSHVHGGIIEFYDFIWGLLSKAAQM